VPTKTSKDAVPAKAAEERVQPPRAPRGRKVVGYAEIAQILDVKVETLRSMAARGYLPAPVDRVANSPLFSAAAINALAAKRFAVESRVGHPSRLQMKARGRLKDAAFEDRVRTAVAEGKGGVTSLRDLASRLGLSSTTLGNRFAGRARWTAKEIEKLNAILGPVGSPDNIVEQAPGKAAPSAAQKTPRSTTKASGTRKSAGRGDPATTKTTGSAGEKTRERRPAVKATTPTSPTKRAATKKA